MKVFPFNNLQIDGYPCPFRIDRNINGGGALMYVREDLIGNECTTHPFVINLGGEYFWN